ncbi:MAG: helix-turn-helix transcriptional regulator [Clostridia bacterium]|nr:helix-turn-helix transcriptional regulator [Clostridia bacterium]
MDAIAQVKWRIKDYMLQKGVSIYELASKADITEACIRNWYTKRDYTPSLEAIIKVSKALEINVVDLFKDEESDQICVSKEEKELLASWSILNDKQKHAVKNVIETFMDK